MTGHTSAAEDGAFTANWARLVEKNHYHQCEPLTGRGGSGLQIGRFVRSLDPKGAREE
jgi:hypothetical protein